MLVDDLADVRAGDKGDTLILAVLARDEEAFEWLRSLLTEEVVGAHYGLTASGPVTRSEVRGVRGLVFRVPGILGGGVTGSLTLDGHGKALGYHLLTLDLHPG